MSSVNRFQAQASVATGMSGSILELKFAFPAWLVSVLSICGKRVIPLIAQLRPLVLIPMKC